MPMKRAMVASLLEVLGLVLVAVAVWQWLSPWAALAVGGLGMLVYGALLDRAPE